MKKFNKAYRLFAACMTVFLMMVSVFAAEPLKVYAAEGDWPDGPEVESDSAIVMEVDTGAILYEKNSHAHHYPASITKILTTLLGIENCDLNETVTFSADAVFKNEGSTSHIARDLNEEMTVEETLYAIMLESANECAWAMAEHVAAKSGGTVSDFIDMMNERAEELGCTDTHFNNPNGLPDTEHYTSAYDMALIGCEAYRNAVFRTITGTKQYTIPPTNKHTDSTLLNNHHKILNYYKTNAYLNPYCTGGKTGYTNDANSTLVTYAEKDGLKLCIVVMDADDPCQFTDTNTLIDYCFSDFEAVSLDDGDPLQGDTGLLNSYTGLIAPEEDSYIVLPKNADKSRLTCEASVDGDDMKVSYYYDGHEAGTAALERTGELASVYFNKEEGTNETLKMVLNIGKIVLVCLLLLVLGLYLFSKFRYGLAHYKKTRAAQKAHRERMKPFRARRRREKKMEKKKRKPR